MEQFKLPEKWCVLRNKENAQILNDWANKETCTTGYNYTNGYITSENIDTTTIPRSSAWIPRGFVEITFEQFKQYVLMEDRKIIGYKLVKPEYKKVVIEALKLSNKEAYEPFIIAGMISYYIPKIKELGIMDWFEPVYEEPKVEYKIDDWITIIDESISWLKYTNTRTFKIHSLVGGSWSLSSARYSYSSYCVVASQIKPATKEEIGELITMRSSSGDFELRITKDGIFYPREDTQLDINILKNITKGSKDKTLGLLYYKGGIKDRTSTYIFNLSKIDVGCKKDTYIEDWKKVLDIYNSLQ